MKFLNAELEHVGRPPLEANPVIDTLAMARKRFPAHRPRLTLCAAASGSIIRAA